MPIDYSYMNSVQGPSPLGFAAGLGGVMDAILARQEERRQQEILSAQKDRQLDIGEAGVAATEEGNRLANESQRYKAQMDFEAKQADIEAKRQEAERKATAEWEANMRGSKHLPDLLMGGISPDSFASMHGAKYEATSPAAAGVLPLAPGQSPLPSAVAESVAPAEGVRTAGQVPLPAGASVQATAGPSAALIDATSSPAAAKRKGGYVSDRFTFTGPGGARIVLSPGDLEASMASQISSWSDAAIESGYGKGPVGRARVAAQTALAEGQPIAEASKRFYKTLSDELDRDSRERAARASGARAQAGGDRADENQVWAQVGDQLKGQKDKWEALDGGEDANNRIIALAKSVARGDAGAAADLTQLAGQWATNAQGAKGGRLSDKDIDVFWGSIGGIWDRFRDAAQRAQSGTADINKLNSLIASAESTGREFARKRERYLRNMASGMASYLKTRRDDREYASDVYRTRLSGELGMSESDIDHVFDVSSRSKLAVVPANTGANPKTTPSANPAAKTSPQKQEGKKDISDLLGR